MTLAIVNGSRPKTDCSDITAQLALWAEEDSTAPEKVLSALYPQIHRIAKSLFTQERADHMLRVIDDEAFRRRMLGQINRAEKRHDLARAVFHGRKGELRQAYREGQEDQLGALGLVINAIVLWNTRYIDAALEKLRENGWQINDEDVARLSPLRYEHINLHGRYHFRLPETIRHGALRDLGNLPA